MITIRMHNGYWTIFVDNKPVAQCASYERAQEYVRGLEVYQQAC